MSDEGCTYVADAGFTMYDGCVDHPDVCIEYLVGGMYVDVIAVVTSIVPELTIVVLFA